MVVIQRGVIKTNDRRTKTKRRKTITTVQETISIVENAADITPAEQAETNLVDGEQVLLWFENHKDHL